MTHLIQVESKVLASLQNTARDFYLHQSAAKPIAIDDTVILQDEAGKEGYFTCIDTQSEPETAGLKKGWQLLVLKEKGV